MNGEAWYWALLDGPETDFWMPEAYYNSYVQIRNKNG